MWTAYTAADLFLVSINSTIRRDGALVVGRGIARQAKERFPDLDVALGRQVQALCGSQGIYGLLVNPRWPTAQLDAFQVKHTTASRPAWNSSDTARQRCAPSALSIALPLSLLTFPASATAVSAARMSYPLCPNCQARLPFGNTCPLARRMPHDQP